jgi:hypothetical protein
VRNHDPLILTISAIEPVLTRIRSIIEGSPVPEDLKHSANTLEWLLRLEPHADEALRIAAFGHDIERAVSSRRINKADFKSFDEFKAAHAMNSARIIVENLEECSVEKSMIEEVFRLVCLHETGGDERSDLLKEADSLSFFEVNLPYYFARNSTDTTFERGVWGYKRLTRKSRDTVKKFRYADERLDILVRQIAMAVEEGAEQTSLKS